MKAILVMGLLALSTSAFSSVVKSYDVKNGCSLYRVIHADSKEPQKPGEILVTDKTLYGITLENMDIDFDAREVKVQVMMNVVLGLNKPLIAKKSTIDERNPNFSMLVNQVNKKLNSLDRICITNDNTIVYGIDDEATTNTKK